MAQVERIVYIVVVVDYRLGVRGRIGLVEPAVSQTAAQVVALRTANELVVAGLLRYAAADDGGFLRFAHMVGYCWFLRNLPK